MDVPPDQLRVVARRWDAVGADLAEATSVIRGAPTSGLGDAAGEAAALVLVVERALTEFHAEAKRVVDGLLVTQRGVVDADESVAASLVRLVPGAW